MDYKDYEVVGPDASARPHVIAVKPPTGRATIWQGPGYAGERPPVEDEKGRTRRVNTGTRLEATTGVVPEWDKHAYAYTTELTAAQAKEISAWETVRSVKAVG